MNFETGKIRELTPIVLAAIGGTIAVTTIIVKPNTETTIAAFGLSTILFGAASGATVPGKIQIGGDTNTELKIPSTPCEPSITPIDAQSETLESLDRKI